MNPALAPACGPGAETRCADCAHLRNGCCEPAAEALAGLGWPGLTVRPAAWAHCRCCPGFEPGEEWLEGLREGAGDREQRALERARGFSPH